MAKITCKSILTKSKLPGADYCCNIYAGCTHACTYCYASFMSRFTGHMNDTWGRFVDYKVNALEVLKREISKVRWNEHVFLASVTDDYQPIERKLELTRECLKIMADYDVSIDILTKSSLVLRDVDVLKRFSQCEVGISCGIDDSRASRILEPGATPIDERFETLKRLKQNGVRCYAFVSPMIPYITNLENIVRSIAGNVDYVMFEAINIKAASKGLLFKNSLTSLVGGQTYGKIISSAMSNHYWDDMQEKATGLRKKYGVEMAGFFRHDNNE